LYEGLFERANKTIIRREFIAATVAGLSAAWAKAAPHQQFLTEPCKRLAVSTYPFRAYIVSGRNKPSMTLEAFAKRAIYRGYFSMEFDSPGGPYAATTKLIEQSISYLS